MIISHKYKYIFIRPTKVASTSVEYNLSKHCGNEDIITPGGKVSSLKRDSDLISQPGQNYADFEVHMCAKNIKKRLSRNVWDNYFKFSIVRNPWDLAVSRFWFQKEVNTSILDATRMLTPKKITENLFNIKAYKIFFNSVTQPFKNKLFGKSPKQDFEFFIKNFNDGWKTEDFYFDSEGKPICDFYIRFENLEEDYKKVCRKLGIPLESLPKTKNKIRKDKKHYSQYYNKETAQIIREKFKKEIEYFGYEWGGVEKRNRSQSVI